MARKKQDMVLKSTKTVQEELEELRSLISKNYPDIQLGV